jgi:hypothetical protein
MRRGSIAKIIALAAAAFLATSAVPVIAQTGSDPKTLVDYPIVRDMDTNMYERQDGQGLEVGGDYRWITSPSVFLQNERGQYAFASLNELISDLVPSNANATLQGIGDGSFAGNSKNYAMYIQDDIKVTPRLTINLGLRYEFFECIPIEIHHLSNQ